MGKRSDFVRRERDHYPTPLGAVVPLIPFLDKNKAFYEPCAGDVRLVRHLQSFGLTCSGYSDIHPIGDDPFPAKAKDALSLDENDLIGCAYIITNPPWDREILHPMIDHFKSLRPTWLLFDADWAHTKQSAKFMPYCKKIVSIGRVKWIEDSKQTGKDNACWYLFDSVPGDTQFIGRVK